MSNYYWSVQWKWMKKYVIGLLIVVIILEILYILGFIYLQKAEAIAINYPAINNCIETYRAINRDGVQPLHDVSQCINDSTTIK